ncbi:MarR family transcriptional regulator [Mycetohabitans sp. B5]|uniref:MarR family transcriptional regulator n=1 Tax=Mycetohabitans endofungorum TaxID=417203 RepID=A0A2P5KD27_9BURK|nr:MarR family transcriptional regulator [Mycetohabitans endofungorum]MCG1055724.1 MarR family transcriptional regulator [Mycetohabitans sp. B5]PPB84592.1 MarR family transcriptional regulator [Mycetohabitans endofungorum]
MELQERIAIFQQFGRTYRAFMTAFESRVGLPLPRWRILLALYDHARLVEPGAQAAGRDDKSHGGPSLPQKRLVERLSIDPGALTRQLKQLESLGWIARSTDERDNRLTNVVLTDAGRQAVERGLPRRNAFLASALGALSDDALHALEEALKDIERCVTHGELPVPAEHGDVPAIE